MSSCPPPPLPPMLNSCENMFTTFYVLHGSSLNLPLCCIGVEGEPFDGLSVRDPQIVIRAPFFQNGAKSGFEMCFGPSTLGAGAKTRLESRIKTFTPHCVCRYRKWMCARDEVDQSACVIMMSWVSVYFLHGCSGFCCT